MDLVRSIFAAWERGDYTCAEWAEPDIEYVIVDGPTPGRWRGVVGMRQGWGTFLAAWEKYRFEADEFRELDTDRVIVLGHSSGQGKASGVELGTLPARGADVFHIRDGRVARLVAYLEHEPTLSELGIEE